MGKPDIRANGHGGLPEHFHMVVEQLPAVVWSTDADLRFTSSQGAGLAEIGLEPNQIVGTRLAAFLDSDDSRNVAVSAHRRALNGEAVVYDMEWHSRCFHVRVEPLRRPDGTVVGTNSVAIDVTERRLSEATIRERETRLQLALDVAGIAGWDLDIASDDLIGPTRLAKLYGLPEDGLIGICAAHLERVHPEDRPTVEQIDWLHLAEGVQYDIEYRVIWPDGSVHWLRERADSIRDGHGEVVRLVGVTFDITARKEAEASLRYSESRFRSLVQNALEMTTIMHADGTIVYESPSNERVLGYKVGDLAATNGFAMVHPDDLMVAREQFAESLAHPGSTIRAELRVRHKNGSWRWVEAIVVNLLHDPAIEGLLINSRDITERKTLEQRLTYLAYHDALTGLANRRQFEERLAKSLETVQQQIVVLLIDLDGFKAVNDSLGHEAGDDVLTEVARKLTAVIRGENLVARFGGDEFAVLFPCDGDVEGATRTAQRLLDLLKMPVKTTAFEVTINASVGIVASTSELVTPIDLLRAADVALYRAKASAAERIAIFDPHLDEAALDRLERERELRHALERGELRLAYQPIVDLASNMIVGVEALLRWQHPTRGMLHPGDFIVVAEESGLIAPIGR